MKERTIEDAIRRAEEILPGGAPSPDGELDARWQAVIAVGEHVETDPEEVWAFVERWGAHADEDLRAAIATCLLEHLLAHDFDAFFPRVRRAARASRLFADTFSRCDRHGQVERPASAGRFDHLQAECRRRG